MWHNLELIFYTLEEQNCRISRTEKPINLLAYEYEYKPAIFQATLSHLNVKFYASVSEVLSWIGGSSTDILSLDNASPSLSSVLLFFAPTLLEYFT